MNNLILIASGICSDYTLATILSIIKRGLSLIQLIVPILLIIAGTFNFIKMLLNPDEKKTMKVFTISVMAAVIVFFLPFIVNLTMSVINVNGDVGIQKNGSLTAFTISSCWEDAASSSDEMDSTNESSSKTISDEEAAERTKF